MDPQTYQTTGETLRNLLTVAWLLPLAGFVVEIFSGMFTDRRSRFASQLAIACIGTGFVCSVLALNVWGNATGWAALKGHGEHHAAGDAAADGGHSASAGAEHGHDGEEGAAHEGEAHPAGPAKITRTSFSGTYYTLARFGDLAVTIDWYIDSLTLVMFVMVTLIATCIHVFATGYMADELTESYADHQVHTAHGHFHRPGRYYRFFAFLSLFCFSMLGLVIAGNVFLVFVFWELVGICSYFLIGFYFERKTASTAANKAFIMNRVGDFGFLCGLMILWTHCGTFRFADDQGPEGARPGLFTMIRGTDGRIATSGDSAADRQVEFRDASNHALTGADGTARGMPYYLLIAAGLGIFAGCVGKSAQFPLQTWLPDAMEGPTPVSALVHSATMVAAGVYLAGRFYPVFTPEVLLVIAYVGCITLFVAATIAVVATDIKRVLAYSTISQLGYMMLGLGVGGWGAGLFHLITHAFFKSLMFLASGSVIHGCHHVQEMPQMGGLLKKMPITGWTMLVGVIAIAGLAIPGVSIYGEKIAFSGYHSKDAIVATALTFTRLNGHVLLFAVPLVTAGITAFYMFRLWFYTFAGTPRDRHVYEHAHESPAAMTGPLLVLAVLAAGCALGGESGRLYRLLIHSEPAGLAAGSEVEPAAAAVAAAPGGHRALRLPSHEEIHRQHEQAGTLALLAAVLGTAVAWVFYGVRWADPAGVQRTFRPIHDFLANKWGFDDLYETMFQRPARIVAGWAAAFDRVVIDGLLHAASRTAVLISRWDRVFDERIVDGLVNVVGTATYGVGRSLRVLQTGQVRNYVTFIAAGLLGLFLLLAAFFPG